MRDWSKQAQARIKDAEANTAPGVKAMDHEIPDDVLCDGMTCHEPECFCWETFQRKIEDNLARAEHDWTMPDTLAVNMSIRECFAKSAMEGMLAADGVMHTAGSIADLAVIAADALIERLNKR